MGSTCNAIAILVLAQNNAIGSAKRNLTSAIIIGFGVTGGIIGSTIFRAQDAPNYIPGIYTTIAMTVFNLIATVCLGCYYILLNRKAVRNGEVIGGIVGFKYSWWRGAKGKRPWRDYNGGERTILRSYALYLWKLHMIELIQMLFTCPTPPHLIQ